MRRIEREQGQATLEYLLVGIVLIAMMGALAALWRFASDGRLSQLVESRASHALPGVGGVFDALLF